MKTEDWLSYEAMYAAMRQSLRTTWLEFDPGPAVGPSERPTWDEERTYARVPKPGEAAKGTARRLTT